MQSATDLLPNQSIDEIVNILQSFSLGTNASFAFAGQSLWKETDIERFSGQTLSKNVLCRRDNAFVNTYFANPDDPQVQHIGEQLLYRYDCANEYLMKLQTAISTAIEINRASIIEERIKVQRVVISRSNLQKQNTKNARITQTENAILSRINKLPEDLVRYIKEYLPSTIKLSALRSCTHPLDDHLMSLKLKNIKGIYISLQKKLIFNRNKLLDLFHRDIILLDDIEVLNAPQPQSTKNALIRRIREICECYYFALNILSKITNSSSRRSTKSYVLCSQTTTVLIAELTYIYKLIHFASRPQFNRRAKYTKTNQIIPLCG